METQSSDPISPRNGHSESKMRRNLDLDRSPANGLAPSPSNDSLKAARQAIRSQVTAREYTERQLVQAQGAIQDLRTKLRHVHHEREAALARYLSPTTAMDAAERTVRAAETALATERATRSRTEGMLRDAEATIKDLREKLATANHNLHAARVERAVERQVHQMADDEPIAAPEIAAPTDRQETAVPKVRRPRGRPHKVVAVPESITSSGPG